MKKLQQFKETPIIGYSTSSHQTLNSGQINFPYSLRIMTHLIVSIMVLACGILPMASQRAYIPNRADNSLSVVDLFSNTVIQTIPNISPTFLPAGGVAITPDGQFVYVTNSDNSVTVINAQSYAIETVIDLPQTPFGIAISPDGSKAFTANNDGSVSAISTITNTVTITFGVGSVGQGIVFGSNNNVAYMSSYGTNNVNQIDAANYSPFGNVSTGLNPYGICISPDGSKIYVANGGDGTINVINTSSFVVTDTVNTGASGLYSICISTDGNTLYAVDYNSNNVLIIDNSTLTISGSIAVGNFPQGIAASPNGNWLCVPNYFDDTISIINANTNSVTSTIPVGHHPNAFGSFISWISCPPVITAPCFSASIGIAEIGGMINSTGCNGYADYSNSYQVIVSPSDVVQVNITPLSGSAVVGLYLDIDHDGNFNDPDEMIVDDGSMDSFGPNNYVSTFTIPFDLPLGNYQLRLVCDGASEVTTQPCSSNSGEIEDYMLVVVPNSPAYCQPNITDPCNSAWIQTFYLSSNSAGYTNLKIQDVSNSCGTNGYSDYTATDSLMATRNQLINGYLGATGVYVPQLADIYIDYNQDLDFNDAGETVLSGFYIPADDLAFFTFNIDANVSNGFYRLRVITRSTSDSSSPCASDIGEAEDFIVNIVDCANEVTPPTVDPYYTTSICAGETTYLEAYAMEWNGTDQYSWYTGTWGGTLAATTVGVNTGVAINPTVTTTYYLRGEGACIASPVNGGVVTINVTSPSIWYLDDDQDGYASSITVTACSSPGPNYSTIINPVDCNDSDPLINPNAAEICGNSVDEDCDGLLNTGCPPPSAINDNAFNAMLVSYSSNMNFPNCYVINGSTITATDSPESTTFDGPDVWYKFVAHSTAVSIRLFSLDADDAIELYSLSGSVLTPIDSENASSGDSDFERMNRFGLTNGEIYYVSVGAVSGIVGSDFTLCIQNLMPSGCSSAQPAGGFSLCSNFKALFRGTPGQGVTYNFTFTGTGGGASGITSLSSTNGLINLANSNLDLRYGGNYDVQVDANYNLQNSAGDYELITISGSTASANCSGVTIRDAPRMEVRSSLRCPAVLLRRNYLIATRVPGDPASCGAVNYTFEFTEVDDCTGLTTAGLPFEVTSSGNTPYIRLSNVFPASLPSTGFWKVRVHANFSYGQGIYGTAPSWVINVNNSSASVMLPDQEFLDEFEKSLSILPEVSIYPNPNNGHLININMSDILNDHVHVRLMNNTGQLIYNKMYSVQGKLNTELVPDEALAEGLYIIEFIDGDEVFIERFVVTK